MTAEFINTLFLGIITYLVHSSVFLSAALLLTSGNLIRNLGLKETILRTALVAGIITAPLQMSGAFDPLAQPIAIPEETAVADTPVFEPRRLAEPAIKETEAAFVPAVSGTLENKPTQWSTATITLIVWAFFGAALLFQLSWLALDLKVQLTGRRKVTDKTALRLVHDLSGSLAIEAPKISLKKNLASPFCLGTGEVVVPDWALDLPCHQLKALLAHEMAHLKRRDPAWLIAGRIVQGVLFFQPLNFLVNRRLGEISEFACDAWSKKLCGSGLALAECLAECAKRQLGQGPAALGMAMATRRSPVIERTRLLLENVRDYSKPASLGARLAVAVLFISAGLTIPAFALDEKIEITKEENFLSAFFGSGSILLENNGHFAINVEYEIGERTIIIEGKGRFQFNDAETTLTSISENGYLDIEEEADKETRRVRWEEVDGEVSETLWLDGKKTLRDSAAEKWLARIIPDFYRLTGIDAEARTKRIFRKAGTNGVLDEMKLIPGDYTFREYATVLVGLDQFSDKETGRFMEMAGELDSSYDLREVLVAYVAEQSPSEDEWQAYVRAAAHISSSYDLRETLSAAAASFSGPAGNWRFLLEAAGNISSSYDLRETLTGFRNTMPKDDATIALLARTAQQISSSYDLRETLSAYAEASGYDTGGWLALLDAAGNVSSSYDLRSTLEVFAEYMPRNAQLVGKYRELLGKIGSDYDRQQAEKAL